MEEALNLSSYRILNDEWDALVRFRGSPGVRRPHFDNNYIFINKVF